MPISARDEPLTPLEVQTFSDSSERKRLTPVALKAFQRLAAQWQLSDDEAIKLLGVSAGMWESINQGTGGIELSQDHLTRVSALVGVFKGLHLLFADDMADRWLRLPNKGPIFNRATPIFAMIEGGIPCMIEVRRYIDAVRGGL